MAVKQPERIVLLFEVQQSGVVHPPMTDLEIRVFKIRFVPDTDQSN